MNDGIRVDTLSDDELLSRTSELVARGRRIDAVLIAHMAEVDARGLHLRQACSSMFAYATERLGLSESQAYERITVARTSRAFPAVLAMLADGRLTLTAAARLGPHLTRDNAESLLVRAAGASKRAVQMLVAEITPAPDVPSSVRRLPARPGAAAAVEAVVAVEPPGHAPPYIRPAGVDGLPPAPPPAPVPAVLVPIAPARFKVQFTASAELEGKIGRARALLRHQIPSGDLAAIIDRALTVLLAELERTRCAATDRPRTAPGETDTSARSRHIPAAVRREIWRRDAGQCTFVDAKGRRCQAREALEIDHIVPFAQGGDRSADNLRLLCRSHNQYQADLSFGRAFMEQKQRRRAPLVSETGPRPVQSPTLWDGT